MTRKINIEIASPDSYGYRPGKSVKQAIAVTRKRCWQYDWVVEFDIKAAFDQIDHDVLLKAVRKHIKVDWLLLYIERWLRSYGASCPSWPSWSSQFRSPKFTSSP
ncbi:reverse transcriptase domain-containing protein [Paraburkholderia sp. DGU8]|uniref:reverse transcriptase domain-containing protein n=1 Tax=Paraburkholderia sp. DGU8 TaxID=3161997 RepID=UPI003466538F